MAAYFDAFGFVPSAAKAIFVHPNTFRYRLRRLTEISGLNLDDPLERLVAELQLRIFADGAPRSGQLDEADSRTRTRQMRSPDFGGRHKVGPHPAER